MGAPLMSLVILASAAPLWGGGCCLLSRDAKSPFDDWKRGLERCEAAMYLNSLAESYEFSGPAVQGERPTLLFDRRAESEMAPWFLDCGRIESLNIEIVEQNPASAIVRVRCVCVTGTGKGYNSLRFRFGVDTRLSVNWTKEGITSVVEGDRRLKSGGSALATLALVKAISAGRYELRTVSSSRQGGELLERVEVVSERTGVVLVQLLRRAEFRADVSGELLASETLEMRSVGGVPLSNAAFLE